MRLDLAACCRYAAWLLVALGLFLRLSQYSCDRSLFLDEAFVATNIERRTFSELLGPLEFDQRAPAGFLVAVKAAWDLFGDSDLVLRLVPLVSGIMALFVFCRIAFRAFDPDTAVIGVLLFALAPTQVFYASDLKPYSTDALCTLLVLGMAFLTDWPRLTWRRSVGMGLLGATICWFSFPAVFVLGPIGFVVFLQVSLRKCWSSLIRVAAMLGLWGCGLGLLYVVQLRQFDPDPDWKVLWSDGFMPAALGSWQSSKWLVGRLFGLLQGPTGLQAQGTPCLPFLLGFAVLYRRQPFQFACLAGPVLAALLAAMVGIYPFSGRSILFLGPIAALVIAQGLHAIAALPQKGSTPDDCSTPERSTHRPFWVKTSTSFQELAATPAGTFGFALLATFVLSRIWCFPGRTWLYVFLAAILALAAADFAPRHRSVRTVVAVLVAGVSLVLVMLYPAQAMARHIGAGSMYPNTLFWKYQFQELKPVMAHIREHWQSGDRVYLYSMSYVAFEFYADRYGFPEGSWVRGIKAGLAAPTRDQIRADLQRLQGLPRVWFVFTHVWMNNGISERELYRTYLDQMGKRLDDYQLPLGFDASVHLYDLSSPLTKPTGMAPSTDSAPTASAASRDISSASGGDLLANT